MKSLLVGKSGTVALVLLGSFVLLSLSSAAAVPVQTFKTGSLIIPMDTDYQDRGMLTAFGLVNKLLASGIPVYWCVDSTKSTVSAVDFTASAIEREDIGRDNQPWVSGWTFRGRRRVPEYGLSNCRTMASRFRSDCRPFGICGFHSARIEGLSQAAHYRRIKRRQYANRFRLPKCCSNSGQSG